MTSGEKKALEVRFDFNSIPPLHLCIDRIADVSVQNETYVFDISEVNGNLAWRSLPVMTAGPSVCVPLNFTQQEVESIMKEPPAIRQLLAQRNVTFKPEDALIISKAVVKFNLRTIHFSPLSTDQKPECYLIKLAIEFDNSRHTGQVFVHLSAIISYVNLCNGRVLQVGTVGIDTIMIGIVDILVLAMCISSFLLCCRALVKAHFLKNVSSFLLVFYKEH